MAAFERRLLILRVSGTTLSRWRACAQDALHDLAEQPGDFCADFKMPAARGRRDAGRKCSCRNARRLFRLYFPNFPHANAMATWEGKRGAHYFRRQYFKIPSLIVEMWRLAIFFGAMPAATP